MEGGIFLTIKDLQILTGCNNYRSACRQHIALRDSLGKKGKHITIKEYCDYEKLDFEYIWNFLRGKTEEKREKKDEKR